MKARHPGISINLYYLTISRDLARQTYAHVSEGVGAIAWPCAEAVESVAFGDDIKRDPFLAGRTQKLSGYSHYYKIRIGDYRVGLRIDSEAQLIEFKRVLHRREIYRKFP